MAGYVLIVDDDPLVTRLVTDILTLLGVEARTAANGRDALAAIKSQLPRAIILDLMMPIMDGFSTLSQLRREADGKDTPVIVLSALADHADMERLPSVAGVVVKGQFSLADLRDALTKVGVLEPLAAPEPDRTPAAPPARSAPLPAPARPTNMLPPTAAPLLLLPAVVPTAAPSAPAEVAPAASHRSSPPAPPAKKRTGTGSLIL